MSNKTNPKVSTFKRHKDKNCVENCWYCQNPETVLMKRYIPSAHYAQMIELKKKKEKEENV